MKFKELKNSFVSLNNIKDLNKIKDINIKFKKNKKDIELKLENIEKEVKKSDLDPNPNLDLNSDSKENRENPYFSVFSIDPNEEFFLFFTSKHFLKSEVDLDISDLVKDFFKFFKDSFLEESKKDGPFFNCLDFIPSAYERYCQLLKGEKKKLLKNDICISLSILNLNYETNDFFYFSAGSNRFCIVDYQNDYWQFDPIVENKKNWGVHYFGYSKARYHSGYISPSNFFLLCSDEIKEDSETFKRIWSAKEPALGSNFIYFKKKTFFFDNQESKEDLTKKDLLRKGIIIEDLYEVEENVGNSFDGDLKDDELAREKARILIAGRFERGDYFIDYQDEDLYLLKKRIIKTDSVGRGLPEVECIKILKSNLQENKKQIFDLIFDDFIKRDYEFKENLEIQKNLKEDLKRKRCCSLNINKRETSESKEFLGNLYKVLLEDNFKNKFIINSGISKEVDCFSLEIDDFHDYFGYVSEKPDFKKLKEFITTQEPYYDKPLFHNRFSEKSRYLVKNFKHVLEFMRLHKISLRIDDLTFEKDFFDSKFTFSNFRNLELEKIKELFENNFTNNIANYFRIFDSDYLKLVDFIKVLQDIKKKYEFTSFKQEDLELKNFLELIFFENKAKCFIKFSRDSYHELKRIKKYLENEC